MAFIFGFYFLKKIQKGIDMKNWGFFLSLSLLIFSSVSRGERYIVELDKSMGFEVEEQLASLNQAVLDRFVVDSEFIVVDLTPTQRDNLIQSFPELKITPDIVLSIPQPLRPFSETKTQAQTIPWGVKVIQAPQAHVYSQGANVKVCLIDTGVDKTHKDLAGNIVGGRNYVKKGTKVNPTEWGDDNGHGTHVAGIVAAVKNSFGVVGVAPKAKIFAVKALDRRGNGYLADIAKGVVECVNTGAKIINMSLGASSDPTVDSPLKRAVQFAVSSGVIVVAAAGNEGKNISGYIPAGYENVMAVSAVNSKLKFPSWSNFGLSAGDVAAPGVNVYSTWKGNSYATLSGTSMAAPHATGVVALSIAAGTGRVATTNLGEPLSKQGNGLVNALESVR